MTQASNVGILTPKINSSGQLDATTGLTGAVPVANGGTGAATYTANNVLLGNGTSAFQVVAPGANGNVLTSNGTTWVSQAASGGGVAGVNAQLFTTSGTFTVPTGVTMVKVLVIGGGGGTNNNGNTPCTAGAGGSTWAIATGLTSGGTLTVTVGAGGAGINSQGTAGTGGTSSITGTGINVSSSGGVGTSGPYGAGGVTGTSTVTTGTLIRGTTTSTSGWGSSWFGGSARVVSAPGTTGTVTWSTTSAFAPGANSSATDCTSSNYSGGVSGLVYIEW